MDRIKLGVAVVASRKNKDEDYLIPLSLGGENDLAPDFLLRRDSLTIFGSKEEANDAILITRRHLLRLKSKWQQKHSYRLISVYSHE